MEGVHPLCSVPQKRCLGGGPVSPRPGAAPCPPVRGRPRVPPSRPDPGPRTPHGAHPKLVLLQTRRQVRPRSSRHHLFNPGNVLYRTGPSIPGAPLGPPRPPPDPFPALSRALKVQKVFRFKIDAKSIPEALATTFRILRKFSIDLAHRQNPGASAHPDPS